MKRIFSLVLAFAILFSCFICANEEENVPTLKVVGGTSIPGRSVEVSLVMENNPGVMAIKIELSYDDTYLTLKEFKDNGMLKTYFGETEDLSDNPYTLCWADVEGRKNNMGNGVLAVLTFDIAKEAPQGDYEIGISYNNDYYEILNEELEAVEFNIENGNVTVAPTPSVSIENVPAKAGDEVFVNLMLSDSIGFRELTFDLSYDESVLSLIEAVPGGDFNGAELLLTTENTETTLYWNMASVEAVPDGILATLKFKVSEGAKKGKYAIKGIYGEGGMTDKDGSDIMFSVKSGEINVLGTPEENVLGDADGNGKVNSKDAIYLSNHLKESLKYPLAILGDVNKDGNFNAMDAIYLLKHIMIPEKFPL